MKDQLEKPREERGKFHSTKQIRKEMQNFTFPIN